MPQTRTQLRNSGTSRLETCGQTASARNVVIAVVGFESGHASPEEAVLEPERLTRDHTHLPLTHATPAGGLCRVTTFSLAALLKVLLACLAGPAHALSEHSLALEFASTPRD